ncbi:MAG: sulfatase-like hydrolase/transferase [Planctomycetota bacterium]
MQRRSFFGFTATVVLSFLTTLVVAESRPNILWLSCEDISPNLGCYGDPDATTPNLDRFAKRSTLYLNAFVTAGVCAPCRSGIISGLYQSSLGTHHMRCRAQLPEGQQLFPAYLREAGYYTTNNSKTDYQLRSTPKNTWDESGGRAHYSRRPKNDQPFFAVFNYGGCHESGVANPRKYQSVIKGLPEDQLHDPAKLSPPPYYPDSPIVRDDWRRYYDVITAMDRWFGSHLKALEESGLSENTIVFFWSDHGAGLPRAKRWLYDSGMRVPLIVYIPKKFRQKGQGVPGARTKQLVSSVDFAPTVLNLAGAKLPEFFQGQPFLGADLPTARQYVYGARDRMDERYDIIRAVRDQRFKYIRNYETWKPYYQYMNTPEKGRTMQEIRRVEKDGSASGATKLFLAESKPSEELYDIENDPHEVHNLAESKEHRAALERLRAAHSAWQVRTRDLGLIPEAEIVHREATSGDRRALLAGTKGRALAAQLLRAAQLANSPKGAVAELETIAKNEDAAVRYWGAIGLGNAILARLSVKPDRLAELLKDKSPIVRIAAARALLHAGVTDSTLLLLKTELASDAEWVRLGAAIVLDEVDEKARPAIPELKKALGDRNKYVARVVNRALNQLEGTTRGVR